MKKIVLITIGCISFALGVIGVILPVIPTVPFLLLALFCFSRSSERMRNWLMNTKLGKKYLAEREKCKKNKEKIWCLILLPIIATFLLIPTIFLGDIICWKTDSMVIPMLYYVAIACLYGMTFISKSVMNFWIKWWISLPLCYLIMTYFWNTNYSIRSLNRVQPGYGELSAGGNFAGAYEMFIFGGMCLLTLGVALLLSWKTAMKRVVVIIQFSVCVVVGLANIVVAVYLEQFFPAYESLLG